MQPEDTITGKLDQMVTLSEALEKLRLRNVNTEFRWDNGMFTAGKGKHYSPEQLTITKTFRFEGESNPSDASVVYVIEATDGLKGYSIDAYGVYSNHDNEEGYNNFIRKIKLSNHPEQLSFEL